MGYRDDFYCVANIIGYSGSLQQFPTVYFQTPKEFGHITQKHPTSQNVGRNAVTSAAGYSIGNESVNGALKLLEKKNGKVFHESRSTLSNVAQGEAQTLSILAQAIWKCTDEKYISSYTKEDFDLLEATEDAKGQVNAEIRKTVKRA